MFLQPFASRTSLVCVHSLILLVRTETEGLRRRLWGRSAPLLLWHRLQSVIKRWISTDLKSPATFLNLIARFSQPIALSTSLGCLHSLILLVRTETEGLRRRLWGRSAPLLLWHRLGSVISAGFHRLEVSGHFSEFDCKILATLRTFRWFRMPSFIDSPCEN
jgi:hypothetical protein